MPIVPILVGAAVGAGVSAATGGKWEKGAIYGAVGGAAGAAINPYSVGASSVAVSAGTVGAVAGGAAGGYASGALARTTPPLPKPREVSLLSPRPREVDLEDIKAEERKRLDRRRGYSSTVLTRGATLGTARTQKARALGV